jgi:hypothetical protein
MEGRTDGRKERTEGKDGRTDGRKEGKKERTGKSFVKSLNSPRVSPSSKGEFMRMDKMACVAQALLITWVGGEGAKTK